MSQQLGKASATNNELTRRLSNQEGEKRQAQLEAIKLRQKMESLEVEMEETEQSWSHEQHRWKAKWEDEKALVEREAFEWIPMRREDERAALQRHVQREVHSIRTTLLQQGTALFQSYREAAERNAELEEEVQRLRATVEATPQDAAAELAELARQRSEHQAMSEQFATREAELTNGHVTEKQALSTTVAELRRECAAMEEAKQKACKDARVAANAEHLMADLAAEAERKLKEEHRRIQASHAGAAAEVDELRDELRDLQAKFGVQEISIRQLQAELSDARSEQRKYEEAAAAAEREQQHVKELISKSFGADSGSKVQQRDLVVGDGGKDCMDSNGPIVTVEHTGSSVHKRRGVQSEAPDVDGRVSALSTLSKQVRLLVDLRSKPGDSNTHKQLKAVKALERQVGKLEHTNHEWAHLLVQQGLANPDRAPSLVLAQHGDVGCFGRDSGATNPELTSVLQSMGERIDSLHSRVRGAAGHRRRGG